MTQVLLALLAAVLLIALCEIFMLIFTFEEEEDENEVNLAYESAFVSLVSVFFLVTVIRSLIN